MSYPPAPPLLLTQRLSSFLHSSLESLQEHRDQQPAGTTLQTALLVTPSGKLLAYESPLPVRTLRTHCSVAASLWAIHASSSPSVAVALGQAAPVDPAQPPSQASPSLGPAPGDGDVDGFAGQDQEEEPYHDGSAPVSIAVSFNGGAVFVVRRLRCGLLFACSTPSPNGSGSRPPTATGPAPALPVADPAAAATAVAAQSSLLPQATLPILPPPPANASAPHEPLSPTAAPPTAASSSSASPMPIDVPAKPASDTAGNNTAPAASVRTMATTETFETAPSGNSHGPAADPGDGSAAAASGADNNSGPDTDADVNADRGANADAASTTTTATTTTVGGSGNKGTVAATLAIARRQVDELALLLDEKLGALSVPEENIGINGFC